MRKVTNSTSQALKLYEKQLEDLLTDWKYYLQTLAEIQKSIDEYRRLIHEEKQAISP